MKEYLKEESLADHHLDRKSEDVVYDWRNIKNGHIVPTASYCDQPFIVKANDGSWVLVTTTGDGHEGSRGQHVISMRSFDFGKTWADKTEVESPDGPEASYAVIYKADNGRIYCFYTYNKDDMREVESLTGIVKRVDTLGAYVFKYSDDNGKSWSRERYEIPVREFECDRQNLYKGKVRFMWNVGKPFSTNGDVFVPLHKVGNFGISFLAQSEGVILKSSNMNTEKDPNKIVWETLPDGDVGLISPEGPIAEEQSFSVMQDGSFFCVYRSVAGHPVFTYSRDGGHTWDKPEFMRYATGNLIKHPRAANFAWKCSNGKYLYWFHNHGGNSYADRNPVWVCMGEEYSTSEGYKIKWSQPEILFYDDDPYIRMSYPDLMEENGVTYISETQKNVARIHKIDQEFLNKLFSFFEKKSVVKEGLVGNYKSGDKSFVMPKLKEFTQKDNERMDYGLKDMRCGFTIDISVNIDSEEGVVLFDSTDSGGKGIIIKTMGNSAVEFIMFDGRTRTTWVSDKNLLIKGENNKLSVIVDGGPKIIMMVVNGKLDDGGIEKQFGWGKFSDKMYDVNGTDKSFISDAVTELRVYDRSLMVCEVVGNHYSLD